MFKSFYCVTCLWLLSVILLPQNIVNKCIHDEITSKDVPSSKMTYKELRNKRDNQQLIFHPLVIHPYYDDIDARMPDNIVAKIKYALVQVLTFIKETIKVRESFSPFLLERQNCVQKWQKGLNKDKCSRVKKGPELCSVKSTDFVIPEQFLYKLELYDYTKIRPIKIIQSGIGVKHANFMLFIISRATSLCDEDGIQAYGSYCRLDNQSRPIAGLLNMCPTYFYNKLFKDSHYYNVIMHEIIHILGFSQNLYSKFKTCTSVHDCETPKKTVVEDLYGIQRLVFPELVNSAQLHSNCSDEDFGGPLDKPTADNTYASHWHPVLMYTSIMTPFIVEDDYVVIDNLTLALLASTGWYKVQYAKAQNFKIGKGEGCDFGSKSRCEDSSYLCTPESTGLNCDIYHKTIGECKKLVPYHQCGVYAPNERKSCSDASENTVYDIRAVHHDSHCFMVSSKSYPKGVPECFVATCLSFNKLEIHINSSNIFCKSSEQIEVDNVILTCPKEFSFCDSPQPKMEQEECPVGNVSGVSVRMHFSNPKFSDLIKYNSFKNFQVSTLRAISSYMSIPITYIYNATLNVFKEVYLDFTICPPRNLSNIQLGTLIQKTQQFLKSPSFAHIFKGATELPVAATEFSTDPDYALSFSDREGLRMLTVIPIVCGIFVVTTVVATIIRYIMKQRPKSRGEVYEIKPTSQSSNDRSSATLLP